MLLPLLFGVVMIFVWMGHRAIFPFMLPEGATASVMEFDWRVIVFSFLGDFLLLAGAILGVHLMGLTLKGLALGMAAGSLVGAVASWAVFNLPPQAPFDFMMIVTSILAGAIYGICIHAGILLHARQRGA